jgi:hypothetical protein
VCVSRGFPKPRELAGNLQIPTGVVRQPGPQSVSVSAHEPELGSRTSRCRENRVLNQCTKRTLPFLFGSLAEPIV